MSEKVVLDTNVFVSAVLSPKGDCREILRQALLGNIIPVFGNALLSEYEDVLGREHLFSKALVGNRERQDLFEALLSVSKWTNIHFLWRPNLRDEADNHVLELAVASGAKSIITHNIKDFANSDLAFPGIMIATPHQWLSRRPAT